MPGCVPSNEDVHEQGLGAYDDGLVFLQIVLVVRPPLLQRAGVAVHHRDGVLRLSGAGGGGGGAT